MKRNKNFNNIFKSTTIRLTGWYLLILMSLSLAFSIIIYQATADEIHSSINSFKSSLEYKNIQSDNTLINTETSAETNLSNRLLLINILILVIGGSISYLLAKRNLLPIEKFHAAQSRFTSDASHELRTPLAVMKTELEVSLRDKNATKVELKETLKSSLEEVDKLSKLSEMLLSLSQFENSELKFTQVNLNKITLKVMNELKNNTRSITVSSTKKQFIIYGNETAIYDLIKILIDNAIQYSLENSKINIDISEDDQFAKFIIKNNGPGITKNKMPYIFDRFFRADASRTGTRHKGYGLGLSLAKNIVNLHNGEIFANSKPNKETTFTVLLPMYTKTKSKC